MDIYKSLEITETMNKQAILDKVFVARKKCVTKQNSANPEKRAEAEELLEVVNDLEILMEFLPESFSQVHLVVKTYQFDFQHEATPDHSVRDIKDSINGDFEAVCRLTNMLREYTQWELSSKWYYTFITRRNVKAYEPYGQDLLFMAETKEGIKWLEKAYDENCISEVGLYNLGISYFGQTSYTKALRYFEEAYDKGYRQGMHHVAWMYETGNGTDVNLEKALEWYERAQQEEGYDAAEDTRRVRAGLATLTEQGLLSVPVKEDERNVVQKILQEHKSWVLIGVLLLLLIIVLLLNSDKLFGGKEKTEESTEESTVVNSGITTRTESFDVVLSDQKVSHREALALKSLVVLNSEAKEDGGEDVALLTDDNYTTAWVDKEESNGSGTSFVITLEKSTNPHFVMIHNGDRTSKENFEKSNRIREICVCIKGEEKVVELQDSMTAQVIELVDCSNVSEIVIKIKSVYSGTENNNTCVSEITVY